MLPPEHLLRSGDAGRAHRRQQPPADPGPAGAGQHRHPAGPGQGPVERQLQRRRDADQRAGLLPVAQRGCTLQPVHPGHPGRHLLRLLLPGGDGLRRAGPGPANVAQRPDRRAAEGGGRPGEPRPGDRASPGHHRLLPGPVVPGVQPGQHRPRNVPRPRRGRKVRLHAQLLLQQLLLGGSVLRRGEVRAVRRYPVDGPARRRGERRSAAGRPGGHGVPALQRGMGKPEVPQSQPVHAQI